MRDIKTRRAPSDDGCTVPDRAVRAETLRTAFVEMRYQPKGSSKGIDPTETKYCHPVPGTLLFVEKTKI